MNMQWERLDIAEQRAGMQSPSLVVAAASARVALFHTIISDTSSRRRFTNHRAEGKDPRVAIRADLETPQYVVEESELLRSMVAGLGRFVNRPMYDDSLTRNLASGRQYRSRVIIPEEVDMYDAYASAFSDYASAISDGDHKLAEKTEEILMHVATQSWLLPAPSAAHSLLAIAMDSAAYLDVYQQSAQPFGAGSPLLSPPF